MKNVKPTRKSLIWFGLLTTCMLASSSFAATDPFAGLAKVKPANVFKEVFDFLDNFVPSLSVLAGAAGALVMQGDLLTRAKGAGIGVAAMLSLWSIGRMFIS